MFKGFKNFIIKGNIFDMATGVILGASFTSIIQSLVVDIITPALGLLINGIDFKDSFFVLKNGASCGPYYSLAAAQKCGAVTLNYGLFLNSAFSFLIVAAVIYAVMKYIIGLHAKEQKTVRSIQTQEEKLLTEIRDILKQDTIK